MSPFIHMLIIFHRCKKTFLLYHCLCNCIRHSEVGGMDREPHSTWVGCLMGCLWDRTHEMYRSEREAPLSDWGWDVQLRDTTISGETGQWSRFSIQRMSLGCPSDWWVNSKQAYYFGSLASNENNILVLSWFRIVSSPTCFQTLPLINLLVKC